MAVRFKDNTRSVKLQTRQDLSKFLRRKAFEVERAAKLSMKGGGKPHIPSRPGEPPHVDEGRLRASITTEFQQTQNTMEARVGTNVRYGRFLEVGTRDIEPRPWLRPALMSVLES